MLSNDRLLKAAPDYKYRYIVCESTYGEQNDSHQGLDLESRIQALAEAAEHTLHKKRGNLIIPAFSMHRTQEPLFDLHYLKQIYWKDKPELAKLLQVFAVSPLGKRVSKIHASELCSTYERHVKVKEKHLNPELVRCLGLHAHEAPELLENILINSSRNQHKSAQNKQTDATPAQPMVIVSSSGMCTGGPILKHLENSINDPRNTILLSGYQSRHTNGALLAELIKEDGASPAPSQSLVIGDTAVPLSEVQADVRQLTGYSGHADVAGLLNYLFRDEERHKSTVPIMFLNHGSNTARTTLREKILDIPTIACHGMFECAFRVSADTLLAASPMISMARINAKRSISSLSISFRWRSTMKRATEPAASIMCLMRIRSSGGILHLSHLQNLIPKTARQISGDAQVHFQTEQLRQFDFHAGNTH